MDACVLARLKLRFVTKWAPRPDVQPGGGPVSVLWCLMAQVFLAALDN